MLADLRPSGACFETATDAVAQPLPVHRLRATLSRCSFVATERDGFMWSQKLSRQRLVLVLALLACGCRASKSPAQLRRGTGWGFGELDDMAALSELGWWYNWGRAANSAALEFGNSAGMEFVAMQWGPWGIDSLNASIQPSVKVLLGFNEPNHQEQSNMLPSRAAQLWPQLEAAADLHGLRLGAPAAASCGGHCTDNVFSPFVWWDQFFGNCTLMYGAQGCRVDLLATHWYGCDAGGLQRFLDATQKYGLPVWVTELDCPNGLDGAEAREYLYLIKALQVLDSHPSVEAYAWYAPHTHGGWIGPTASLLEADTPQLSHLGRAYLQYGIREDYVIDPAMLAADGLRAHGARVIGEAGIEIGVWDESWEVRCAPCARWGLDKGCAHSGDSGSSSSTGGSIGSHDSGADTGSTSNDIHTSSSGSGDAGPGPGSSSSGSSHCLEGTGGDDAHVRLCNTCGFWAPDQLPQRPRPVESTPDPSTVAEQ